MLSREVLEDVFRHAEAEYPQECCGLVFQDGSVRRGRNIQNELHAADPVRYPRDARTGYVLSVEDQQALQRSLKTDCPAVVVYHSHPDVGAYFSEEDCSKALFCGQPILPVNYLVVDVRAGKARGASLFGFRDGAFVEIEACGCHSTERH